MNVNNLNESLVRFISSESKKDLETVLNDESFLDTIKKYGTVNSFLDFLKQINDQKNKCLNKEYSYLSRNIPLKDNNILNKKLSLEFDSEFQRFKELINQDYIFHCEYLYLYNTAENNRLVINEKTFPNLKYLVIDTFDGLNLIIDKKLESLHIKECKKECNIHFENDKTIGKFIVNLNVYNKLNDIIKKKVNVIGIDIDNILDANFLKTYCLKLNYSLSEIKHIGLYDLEDRKDINSLLEESIGTKYGGNSTNILFPNLEKVSLIYGYGSKETYHNAHYYSQYLNDNLRIGNKMAEPIFL